MWSVSIFTAGVSYLPLRASFVWSLNNQVVSFPALPIQISDSQQHPILQNSTWSQSFRTDTAQVEKHLHNFFCFSHLSESEEWVRGGEGEGDLSVEAEISICGQDGENFSWVFVCVVTFTNFQGVWDTRELWGVVIVVQDSDVELSCGIQTISDLIHCHDLNRNTGSNMNSSEKANNLNCFKCQQELCKKLVLVQGNQALYHSRRMRFPYRRRTTTPFFSTKKCKLFSSIKKTFKNVQWKNFALNKGQWQQLLFILPCFLFAPLQLIVNKGKMPKK